MTSPGGERKEERGGERGMSQMASLCPFLIRMERWKGRRGEGEVKEDPNIEGRKECSTTIDREREREG